MLKISLTIGLFIVFSLNLFAQSAIQQLQKYQSEYKNKFLNKSIDSVKGWKQFKRWEYFWENRLQNSKHFPNIVEQYKNLSNENTSSKNSSKMSTTWTHLGPFQDPKNSDLQGVGRINIVKFHPNNEQEIWVGAASGGAWKSINGGNTWEEVKYTGLMSIAVSDITFAPSKPSTIYIATGDANGTLGTGSDYYSVGILKSTDGGVTWKVTNFYKQLQDLYTTCKILVSSTDENYVLASTLDGVHLSKDGGNTWTRVYAGGTIKDIKFKSNDENVIVGASFSRSGGSRIIRSIDKGQNWTIADTIGSMAARTDIAFSPSNPNRVYAVSANFDGSFNSFRTSTNAGQTWEAMSNTETVGNILAWATGNDSRGQGTYDLCIAVNPNNEKEVYVGGVNIWKTTDAGESFDIWAHNWSISGTIPIKSDQHDFLFSKNGKYLYIGNDGGIYRYAFDTKLLSSLNTGLSITQYYRMGVSQSEDGMVIGGAQDNGSSLLRKNEWTKVRGADGMECIVDPTNPEKMYASIYFGSIYRSTNGGKNFSLSLDTATLRRDFASAEEGAWVTPFVLDPQRANVMYAGYNEVWKNTQSGDRAKWVKISNFGLKGGVTLRSLAVSPSDSNVIYAASVSRLWVTKDGGKNWEILLNSGAAISYISVNATNPNIVYVSKSGFNASDKVEMYDGSRWTNITGNLPNVPANSIVYQKNSPNRIYIGTDIGVFFSENGSGVWTKLDGNLPNVIVLELEIREKTNELFVATYGRGMWKTQLLDCQYIPPVVSSNNALKFCKGDSVVLSIDKNYSNVKWSNGSTENSIIVKESGSFSYIIDEGDCLKYSNLVSVEVLDFNPIKIVNSNVQSICEGDTIQLSATLGYSNIQWSNGETTRNIKVTQPGTYYVTGETFNGCKTKSEEIVISEGIKTEIPSITKNGNTLTSSQADLYQWYKNGAKINGATSQELVIDDKNANYSVSVVVDNSCFTMSDIISSIEDETDVKEFSIFPNPNNGAFSIMSKHNSNNQLKVTVTALNGVEVDSFDVLDNSKEIKMDVKHLSKGTYLIKIMELGHIIFTDQVIVD